MELGNQISPADNTYLGGPKTTACNAPTSRGISVRKVSAVAQMPIDS